MSLLASLEQSLHRALLSPTSGITEYATLEHSSCVDRDQDARVMRRARSEKRAAALIAISNPWINLGPRRETVIPPPASQRVIPARRHSRAVFRAKRPPRQSLSHFPERGATAIFPAGADMTRLRPSININPPALQTPRHIGGASVARLREGADANPATTARRRATRRRLCVTSQQESARGQRSIR